MEVFCDRPTLALCVRLARARARGVLPRGTALNVLDERGRSRSERMSRATLSRVLGLELRDLSFSAADMLTADGAALRPAARRLAFRFALAGARAIIERSSILRRINQQWGRDTVALHVANGMWLEAERVCLRILVADALRRERSAQAAVLYVAAPDGYVTVPDALTAPAVRVHWYRGAVRPWSRTRAGAIGLLIRESIRAWRRFNARILDDAAISAPPAVLLPQEDEISLDHSYRAQPHWLMPDASAPSFRTLVLAYGAMPLPTEAPMLEARRVEAIRPETVHRTPWRRLPAQIRRRMTRDFRQSLGVALLGPSKAVVAAGIAVARLLAEAASIGAFCVRENVRVFMTCENYMLPAAAARLVAAPLGVRTIGYQYSNLASQSLVLLTTSDIMATFSPHFHDRFVLDGIEPGRFEDVGYPFSGREVLVRRRAEEQRRRLLDAGARFVVGFFDESAGQDRFGIFNQEKYEESLLELLDFMLTDVSVGLVFKTQFHRNLAGATPKLLQTMTEAEQTGRFLMPMHGRTRNTVLPTEVAVMSDVVIGHRVGATASLEAALAGARSLLIDLKGFQSASDHLYSRCDIVYPSMAAALEAVRAFRTGDPARRALGDWTPILSQFDPFRDGRAGARLRAVVERAMDTGHREVDRDTVAAG